ncbi:MAG: hypothetical protein PHY02_08985 [Phycisphaerae bacterium]|nr:hypothetical protein [Phycisphaerae bacterium]
MGVERDKDIRFMCRWFGCALCSSKLTYQQGAEENSSVGKSGT